MFLLGSYIWMSSGTQLKSVVLQSCILSSSHSTRAALTILLLFFRVSLSIHPRLVILFQKSKKPQKWQYRLLNSTFVLVTDCQGNLHPHSVCCVPRTHSLAWRELTNFHNHIPTDKWRALGMSEDRPSGSISAVHDSPAIPFWLCVWHPVTGWFVPPPSGSSMPFPTAQQSWS